ncbi:MAG TPA: SDR family oxidoreductase [Alphaproteobacteria bacterium]|jgi:3-oxoacyl-[acyl-carrier protein] reductase|nr:SDR family oxidoreductase [Alphaproteobacteria bacterium]
MGRLDGKVAIVTGSGRGIGREIARRLAAEGAALVVNDLDEAPAQEVLEMLAQAGARAVACNGDVAAPGFGERAVESALDAFGRLDIIVNNAGYIWNTTIQNSSDQQWQAMLEVHATAPYRLLRAASGYIREAAREEAKRDGRAACRKVVNISSVSGVYGAATQSAYAAGKMAVVGLTRSLAKEWGRYNVTVNAVAFGFIETRLTQAFAGDPATIAVHGRQHKVGFPEQAAEALKRTISLGRSGTPAEAAGAVYMLCSPDSDYITGQVLMCDGGRV